jgi:outer membrane protein assembly factor BamB
VAFDRKTGEERWRALSDRASYSAPVLIEQGGKPVLVAWTGERVAGLNPQDGKLLWEAPFPAGQIVDGVSTPAVDGDRLFVSSVYEGSLMLKLGRDKATVEKVWQKKGADGRDTDPIHSLIPTPILSDGHIYGIDYNGELRCVDGKTGQRVWEETSVVPKAMWATAHLIRNGDRALLFNEKGELIVAKLSPKGYSELSRARLIAPTRGQLNQRGGVAWSHPAFAYGHVFARNDEELICADLRAR